MPLLQYLNGIDVPQPFGGVIPPEYRAEGVARGLLDYDMAGLAQMALHSEAIDQVTGTDALDDYNGVNGVEDCEVLRDYLLKTKALIDECPQMVQTYVNPTEFSNMLDYVLRHWDTSGREAAVEKMAARERKLIEDGKVAIDQINEEGAGGGFFTALWACVRPQSELAEASQEILAAYKGKLRAAAAYAREHDGRVTAELLSGLSGMDDGETLSTAALYGWDWHEEAAGLNGEETQVVADIENPDTDYCKRYLTNLYDLVSSKPSDFFADEAEAQRFKDSLAYVLLSFDNGNLDAAIAELSARPGQLGGFFKKIGKAFKKAAKKVGKGIKKAAKTVGKGIKKAAKTVGKGVKKAGQGIAKGVKATGRGIKNAVRFVGKSFKKLGKKICKVLKKVVKFIIRFNPLTAAIRGILMLAARFNWFRLAERAYPGSKTWAEAQSQLKIKDKSYYDKCAQLYKKFSNFYTKIGGKESKLKGALEKGSKKKWNGGEVTEKSVTKASIRKLKDKSGGDKAVTDEAEAEVKAVEQAQATAKGYTLTEDSKLKEGETKVTKVETKTTLNEYVTTQAATFYLETASSKAAGSIPKGTKLIIDADTKGAPICYDQTGENAKGAYYRTQYQGKYVILPKTTVKSALSGLMGLGGLGNLKLTVRDLPPAKVTKALAKRGGKVAKVARVMLRDGKTGRVTMANKAELLYSEDGHALGFGWSVVAAIASATSALAGFVAMMLKLFGKDKAANVLTAVSAGAGVAAVGAGVAASVQQSKASQPSQTASKPAVKKAAGQTASATKPTVKKAASLSAYTAKPTGVVSKSASSSVSSTAQKVIDAAQKIRTGSNVGAKAAGTVANIVATVKGQQNPAATTSQQQSYQDNSNNNAAAQTANAKAATPTSAAGPADGQTVNKKWIIYGAAGLGGIALLGLLLGGKRN